MKAWVTAMGIKAALVLVGLSVSALPVQAGFFTGNDIFQHCGANRAFLNGFAAGSFDKTEVAQSALFSLWLDALPQSRSDEGKKEWDKSSDKAFSTIQKYCTPKGVNLGQVADIFCQYLTKTPSSRHLPAIEIFNTALGDAWPCPAAK